MADVHLLSRALWPSTLYLIICVIHQSTLQRLRDHWKLTCSLLTSTLSALEVLPRNALDNRLSYLLTTTKCIRPMHCCHVLPGIQKISVQVCWHKKVRVALLKSQIMCPKLRNKKTRTELRLCALRIVLYFNFDLFWTPGSFIYFYRAAWNADAVLRWDFCPSVCLSVCPSVCLSVCLSVKRVHCDKTEERYV